MRELEVRLNAALGRSGELPRPDPSAYRAQPRGVMTRAARSEYEELLLSPVGALARYRDADGRPLCGEAIASDPEFRSQLELRRCPYPVPAATTRCP